MQIYKCALFCAILALSILEPITARKGFSGGRHSYPKSGGLSGGGGGHHGYPSSGGLSGGGGRGYPSSGGSHSYPSSGGSPGYPSSGGLSGNSPGRVNPQSGGSHSYPSSGGSHGYPASGGLSGNNNNRGSAGSTTNVHHHYHYNPPQSIAYTSNGRSVNYPVYQGTPPTYVYKYKDSGSKYGTLLTGLALLNLGALAGTAYAVSQSHGHGNSNSGSSYRTQPGEVCKFGLKTKTSREETRIDCHLILNFILSEQAKNQTAQQNHTIVSSSTTITNVTIVNNTNPVAFDQTTTPKTLFEQLPNGTFVAVTSIPVNTTDTPANASNPIQQSVVTMTTTNTTTVVDALDVKGKPVEVTPDMECYVIRTTPTTYMRKEVPLIISVCWVAGAVVGLLPLFGWHAAVGNTLPGCYFVEVMDYNYLLFLYFATIVTPSVLLAAFYAHIYRVVVKQMSEVMTVDGRGGRCSSGTMLRVLGAAQKREVKATQNLAIIVFFFIICWIPLYTINAVKAFLPELDIPNPLTYVCIIVSHLNSAINPLLYAYHLKDFRAALKGLICSILGRGVPIPAAYRPPVPIRRPDLERCNAIRTRPKVYVNSPVWLRQKEEEKLAAEEDNKAVVDLVPVADVEPFLQRVGADGSSGRHTPEGREGDGTPYLIGSGSERCQSPYRKVEELIRRVRSVSGEHSHS